MSGVAGADRLRALVVDYYHGLLTFDSYREQRSKLLDTLQLEARQPQPAVETAKAPDVTQSKTAARPVAPPAPAAAPPAPAPAAPRAAEAAAPRSNRIAIAAAAGVVALGLVAFVAYRQLGSGGDAAPAPGVADPAATVALPPGAALLEQFMQRNAWTPDSVRNLGVTWNSALSEEQRQAARASPTYTRFSDVVRRRLREEEALSGAQRSTELESLVNLAKDLQMPFAASLELPSAVQTAPIPPSAPAAARTAAEGLAPRQEVAAPEPAVASREPPPVPGDEPASRPREQPPAPASAAPASAVASSPPPAPAAAATTTTAPPPAAQSTAAASDGNPACSAELFNTRRPFCRDALRGGGEAPALVILPAGSFVMGGDQPNESPRHDVTLPAIAMSVNEVSFADFGAYCAAAGVRCPDNPWSSPDFPVVLVSWNEAVAYTEWLSAQTGRRYRLPSEAEWEYAARARTESQYPFGDVVTPIAARSSANGPVDSPLANSDRSVNRNDFRLYHMIGNVREWVADSWQADYAGALADGSARAGGDSSARVVRGGAYNDGARQLRSAARVSLDRAASDRMTGFRVVRELGE
jgi:formylglycine-generating enzyme required for sulfatase activity